MNSIPAEEHSSRCAVILRCSPICRACPLERAAPEMVRGCMVDMTETSKAAGQPACQLGTKTSAGWEDEEGTRNGLQDEEPRQRTEPQRKGHPLGHCAD